MGLDIGCGAEKIKPAAIGIDSHNDEADLSTNLNDGLGIFRSEIVDYIFSSHCLEDLDDPRAILADWWRVIAVGGYLVLYLPHKELYPNVGHEDANPHHKHDFCPGDIVGIMEDLGASFEIVHHETRDQRDEYSFDLVLRKIGSVGPCAGLTIKDKTYLPHHKSCLVIRYGGFGDHIQATCVLPMLKEQGYRITYNGVASSNAVLRYNPYIDEFWLQEKDVIPMHELGPYFEVISRGFDKVVNLTESVEKQFLAHPSDPEIYNASPEERRKTIGRGNYYRHAIKLAGGDPKAGNPRGELYLHLSEQGLCEQFRNKYRDKFLIVWCLAGSAMHKAYLHAEDVAYALLDAFDDLVIVTVGDMGSRLLEWEHERTICKCGRWDMRTSLIMTKYADLVISPETAVLNAAGCFDTPKIGLLTHSSKENLTSTFINDYSIQADIECSPCHKLVYIETVDKCPKACDEYGEELESLCACAAAFPPPVILDQVEYIYRAWHLKRGTTPKANKLPKVLPAGYAFNPEIYGKIITPTGMM
jgi:ADP-heptose:LPS heptosyltransferase/predicted SAM-dependent methyltransferase